MPHTKPQVTIDLDEYNELLALKNNKNNFVADIEEILKQFSNYINESYTERIIRELMITFDKNNYLVTTKVNPEKIFTEFKIESKNGVKLNIVSPEIRMHN